MLDLRHVFGYNYKNKRKVLIMYWKMTNIQLTNGYYVLP